MSKSSETQLQKYLDEIFSGTVKETKTDLIDLNEERIVAAKKTLGDFEKYEKEKHDREEAMNSLEGLLYDLAVRLEEGEEYADFATEEEKKAIPEEVAIFKLWFEDNVSLETKKEDFDTRRAKLEELTAKPNARKQERLEMPRFAEVLEDHFNRSMTFHAMALDLTQFEEGNKTFTETELEVLTKLIESTSEWWIEKKDALEMQPKNEDPVVKVSEVADKARDLEREVRYLVNKLKIASAKKRSSLETWPVSTHEQLLLESTIKPSFVNNSNQYHISNVSGTRNEDG